MMSAIFSFFPDRQLPSAAGERILSQCLMQCIHTYFCLFRASGAMITAHPEMPMG